MKSRKNEEKDYLKRFENMSSTDILNELSAEAQNLKKLIQDILNRAKNNGK